MRKALAGLDVKVDEHWTPDGLPAVEHLAATLRDQGITRAMIEAVEPLLTREKLMESADL